MLGISNQFLLDSFNSSTVYARINRAAIDSFCIKWCSIWFVYQSLAKLYIHYDWALVEHTLFIAKVYSNHIFFSAHQRIIELLPIIERRKQFETILSVSETKVAIISHEISVSFSGQWTGSGVKGRYRKRDAINCLN